MKALLLGFYHCFIPSSVFLKFLLAALIPAISDQIIPLFFTGQIPNEKALALASQFTFISIILEVVQEGIVNSQYYLIGRNYEENRRLSLQSLKICLIILVIMGSLLTTAMLIFVPQFVKIIDTPGDIAEATETFLRSSAFSYPLLLLNEALTSHLYITTSSWIMAAYFSQIILSFLLNFFFFGQQTASLHWGIEELGYFKVIQIGVNLLNTSVFFFVIEGLLPWEFLFDIPLFENMRQNFKRLFQVSWGNFGDSAVRNFFYFMVTLKFLNYLGGTEMAAWSLLNTIIWGVFLIPAYTVSKYVKVTIGHAANSTNLKDLIRKVAKKAAISMTSWLILVGVAGTFLWPTFASYFQPLNKNVQEESEKMFYSIGWIYVFFSYNNTMDALFYGTGKTQFVFYQSLITNLVVNLMPWVLYLDGLLIPTYEWVSGTFIAGMLVDFGLTAGFSVYLWKTLPSMNQRDA